MFEDATLQAGDVAIPGIIRRRALGAAFECAGVMLKRKQVLTDGDITWVVRDVKGDARYCWAQLALQAPPPPPAADPAQVDLEDAIAAAGPDDPEEGPPTPAPTRERKRKVAAT